jgi:hypothetical protein
VAARCKAWKVFARWNTRIVGSIPTRGMDVCVRLFCVCVVLCAGRGLATGWSPVQGVLANGLRNWRGGQGPKGCIYIEREFVWRLYRVKCVVFFSWFQNQTCYIQFMTNLLVFSSWQGHSCIVCYIPYLMSSDFVRIPIWTFVSSFSMASDCRDRICKNETGSSERKEDGFLVKIPCVYVCMHRYNGSKWRLRTGWWWEVRLSLRPYYCRERSLRQPLNCLWKWWGR